MSRENENTRKFLLSISLLNVSSQAVLSGYYDAARFQGQTFIVRASGKEKVIFRSDEIFINSTNWIVTGSQSVVRLHYIILSKTYCAATMGVSGQTAKLFISESSAFLLNVLAKLAQQDRPSDSEGGGSVIEMGLNRKVEPEYTIAPKFLTCFIRP